MSTLGGSQATTFATGVRFDEKMLHVQLSDGREISAPLNWFPKLRNATSEQRSNWKLIGNGVGIHWDDLDEDLSVAGLLGA
jgi:Protein of unknown function (DUF2442)